MPSTTNVLDLVVRTDRLSSSDWLTVLRDYSATLKPHLETFTLPEFRTLSFLRSDTHTRMLGNEWEHRGDQKFSATTQGIFDHPDSAKVEVPDSGWDAGSGYIPARDGKRLVWGLVRGGLWMLAEVVYTGHPGYRDRGEQLAKAVSFQEVDPKSIVEMVDVHPYLIVERIHEAVIGWVDHRQRLWEQAASLKSKLETNRRFLDILYKREL